MKYYSKCLLMGLLLLGITSCGGGGTDPTPVVRPPDPVEPPAATFSVSGAITATTNTEVDSDINDPSVTPVSNNEFTNPQAVPAPLVLNGFVTELPTNNTGDVFANIPDVNDFYEAELIAGQYVSLRVIGFNPSDERSIDVDVGLYNASGELIVSSISYTEYESVQVPANGTYTVRVVAYSGSSKYVLNIGNSSIAPSSHAAGINLDNIVLNEAIVSFKSAQAASGMNSLGVSLTSTKGNRPTLLKLNSSFSIAAKMLNMPSTSSKGLSGKALSTKNTQKMDTLNLIKSLNARDDIEYSEPNFIRQTLLTPNDTHYPFQWHYPVISLPQAWDITTGTPTTGDVIVAVVDTGVVLTHPDFEGKLVSGFDFISNPAVSLDGNGYDNDPTDVGDNGDTTAPSSWHGTHVAGTIGAATNNNTGVAGVSWGAKIMPIRVIGKGGGTDNDILQGIRFAAGLSNDSGQLPSRKADIINLSLGGGDYSQTWQDTLNEIRNAGVIVIAAAGNDGDGRLKYPASNDNVISVAATEINNDRAYYSNFNNAVDVAAPGGDARYDQDGNGYRDSILSVSVDDSNPGALYPYYKFEQGTSMAAPHMAGVVALMKAVYPALTPQDLDSLLVNGSIVNDLGNAGRDDAFGYGLINALKAVQAAQQLAGGATTGALLVAPQRINFGKAQTNTSLLVSRIGTNPPNITDVSANHSAITIDASPTSTQQGISYSVRLDRTGLADGIYNAAITIASDSGNDIVVPVSFEMGNVSNIAGNTGYLYLLVRNTDTGDIKQVALTPTNGVYRYRISDLPSGEYQLVGGSDIDNDGRICDSGEACARYPENTNNPVLNVEQNLDDINFTASVVTGLSGSSASSVGGVTSSVRTNLGSSSQIKQVAK